MADLLTIDPDAFGGPTALSITRRRALARFEAGTLPDGTEEIWRYSRIGELDPGAFRVARPASASAPVPPAAVEAVLALTGRRAATVRTVDGAVVSVDVAEETTAAGVTVGPGADGTEVGALTDAVEPWDPFVDLNTAQAPSPVVVNVPAGTVLDHPIVVCHWVGGDAAAVFPRVVVRLGANAVARVVEYVASADVVAWVDPVSELILSDGAQLDHLVVQELGPRVWQTAYLAGQVARGATLRSFVVGLGGSYARVRTDVHVVGPGGATELSALYCGDGTQMHDFRTLQHHGAAAVKSTSDLVFKGAVQDGATSAYSGLIRIERGASGTRAFQTNRNLILSDSGLASYSVPNLDIEEADVSCSHASATGPIDPEQRFYLESRGVPPEVADRLIVLGFFDDLLERLVVPGLAPHLRLAVARKLALLPEDGRG